MAKLKMAAVLAVAVAVGGCMKIEDYPQELNAGTAELASRQGFDRARLIETQPKILRTMVATGADGKGRKEVRGAECEMSSPEVFSRIHTPQMVQAPVIKGKPGQMVVTCKLDGKTGQLVWTPSLEYRRTQVSGSGSNQAALAGLLITVAVNAARASKAKKEDEWQYLPSESKEVSVLLQ